MSRLFNICYNEIANITVISYFVKGKICHILFDKIRIIFTISSPHPLCVCFCFCLFLLQMYSGTFTHFIKPVLPTSQIEKLFGLLGYQLISRHNQLRLQPSRVSPGSLGDLLSLACAFFLARCECRLLLMALGKHAGETQWELSVVRERQKGNSVEVCNPIPDKCKMNVVASAGNYVFLNL